MKEVSPIICQAERPKPEGYQKLDCTQAEKPNSFFNFSPDLCSWMQLFSVTENKSLCVKQAFSLFLNLKSRILKKLI